MERGRRGWREVGMERGRNGREVGEGGERGRNGER